RQKAALGFEGHALVLAAFFVLDVVGFHTAQPGLSQNRLGAESASLSGNRIALTRLTKFYRSRIAKRIFFPFRQRFARQNM
ncbi:hypothetical protein, partial [Parvibaculum sp.]|uniref:hypothetical protein n=1 Tax=Parvibaculum sp. TaxID=2024848 RepID=UPI00349FFBA4